MAQGVLGYKTGHEVAEIAYAFLNCDFLTNPEVSVFNKAYGGNKDRPGFIVGSDIYAEAYSQDNMPPFKELFRIAMKNDFCMALVASFDEEDRDRISMTTLLQDDGSVAIIYNRPFSEGISDIERLKTYLNSYHVD